MKEEWPNSSMGIFSGNCTSGFSHPRLLFLPPRELSQLLWGEAVPWRIPWDDFSRGFRPQFPLKLLELWPHECESAQGSSRGGCNPTEIPLFHELWTFPDPFIFWSEFFTLGDCFAWMSWTQSLQAAEFRDVKAHKGSSGKKNEIIVIGANQLQIQLFQMERNLFQQSCEPENRGANSHHDSKMFNYRHCKGTPNTPGSDPAVLHTWIPQLESLRSNPGLGQQEMNPTAASWDGNCSGSLWGVQSWEWGGIHWIPRISQAENWNFHPELSKEEIPGWAQQSKIALRWKSMGILVFLGKSSGASGGDRSAAACPELRWLLRLCGSVTPWICT